jgi:hypothetical protein
VRFLVELTRGEGGRVSGAVSAADAPSVPFSGWLELLRLLEEGVDPQHRGDGVTG